MAGFLWHSEPGLDFPFTLSDPPLWMEMEMLGLSSWSEDPISTIRAGSRNWGVEESVLALYILSGWGHKLLFRDMYLHIFLQSKNFQGFQRPLKAQHSPWLCPSQYWDLPDPRLNLNISRSK